MSRPEFSLSDQLKREFDPRPGDAFLSVLTEIPFDFIPLQTGGYRSPLRVSGESVIYLPRGSTAGLIMGDDFDFFLVKFMKKNDRHPDDRISISYDGTFRLESHNGLDFYFIDGGDSFSLAKGYKVQSKKIDDDLSFQVHFTG